MISSPIRSFKTYSFLRLSIASLSFGVLSALVPACDTEDSSNDESVDTADGDSGTGDNGDDGNESSGTELTGEVTGTTGMTETTMSTDASTSETTGGDSSTEDTSAETGMTSESTGDDENSIADIAQNDDRFTTLVSALVVADLVTSLDEGGPFTVFAPTNAAFDALPDGALDNLLADKEALKSVLLHHVVDGKVQSSDLPEVPYAKSLLGQTLLVDLSSGVKISGVNVSQPDVEASNGFIHVVDGVILPPSGSVVDVAVGNPDFSTLVTALQTAELVDTLSGDGPFTVFAPTNAAFDALPDGVLDGLLADKEALTKVLLYHVAGAEVYAADLADISMVDTLLKGQSHTVDLSKGVKVGDSMVVTADVLATNGVIHIIDTVLVPPSE